jgi:hypothetical protein
MENLLVLFENRMDQTGREALDITANEIAN